MAKTEGPVTIKKYANRRLYNTGTSTYVTLEDLATMVKNGEDFAVFDAKTGEDITRSVLTQIIFEQENKEGGQNLLPINFLRQLIRFYGDSMQKLVPSYLEVSLESFTREQEIPASSSPRRSARRRSVRCSRIRSAATWKCSSRRSRCSRHSGGARRRRGAARPRSRRLRPDRSRRTRASSTTCAKVEKLSGGEGASAATELGAAAQAARAARPIRRPAGSRSPIPQHRAPPRPAPIRRPSRG